MMLMMTITMNQIIIMNQNMMISLWSHYFLKINRITGIIDILPQSAPHPFAVKSESTYGGRGVSFWHSVIFASFGMLWEEWPQSPAWHKITMILMDWISKLIFMLHKCTWSFDHFLLLQRPSSKSRTHRGGGGGSCQGTGGIWQYMIYNWL